ncbi:putative ATP-dependent RNA helicase DDX31 [Armadillidium vulgare]|nr:putative ATP-dependent RNA helicase DDX31 [Armadillidium vulgare]
MDHIDNTNSLELDKIQYLILDEADRMLDMGYEQNIKSIIFSLNKVENPVPRQTVMLSATLTNAVEKLAGITLKSPKIIDVTSDLLNINDCSSFNDEYLVTPENLKHHFMLVPMKVRLVSLAAFIIEKCKFSDEKKILVFMTTQDMVDYHTSLFAHVLSKLGKKKSDPLERRALKVLSGESDDEEDEEDFDEDPEDEIHFMKLHGSMSQPERTAVFKSFHDASSGVLLCTDVASRGIDLPRVNWIVQYNPASNTSDYVHRVGRTARANLHGSAIVFISPSESTYISLLEKQGISFTELRMENVLKILTHPSLYVRDVEKVPANMEIAATRIQDKFENAVEGDPRNESSSHARKQKNPRNERPLMSFRKEISEFDSGLDGVSKKRKRKFD